jgi:hypothetical protein
METTNNFIKFGGKAEIPEALALGDSYDIKLTGEITSITDSSNQDGTKSVYYKFEPILAAIEKENGATLKTKDLRSMSVKLRKVLYFEHGMSNDPRPIDMAYEDTMKDIIFLAPEIYKKNLNRYNEKKV